jgi:hypothetical protein
MPKAAKRMRPPPEILPQVIRLKPPYEWRVKRLRPDPRYDVSTQSARRNVRFGVPDINRGTLAVAHLLDTLAPFVPSAGILLEF